MVELKRTRHGKSHHFPILTRVCLGAYPLGVMDPGFAPGWAGPVSVGLDPCRNLLLLPVGSEFSPASKGPSICTTSGTPTRRQSTTCPFAHPLRRKAPDGRKRQAVAAQPIRQQRLTRGVTRLLADLVAKNVRFVDRRVQGRPRVFGALPVYCFAARRLVIDHWGFPLRRAHRNVDYEWIGVGDQGGEPASCSPSGAGDGGAARKLLLAKCCVHGGCPGREENTP